MQDLSFAAWITLANIIILLGLVIFTKIKKDVVFLVTLAIFVLSGTLDMEQAFSGFISNAVLISVFFAVIVGSMHKTHVVQWAMSKLLGNDNNEKRTLLKLIVFACTMSLVMPDLILGLLIYGGIDDWAGKHSLRPSRLLLPVGYAITFGSSMCIIGRSGGLVWANLYEKCTGDSLALFAPFCLGLVCAVVGVAVLMITRKRLPDRESSQEIGKKTGEFMVELVVPKESGLCGMTIAESGLYASDDFSIVSVTGFDGVAYCDISPDACIVGGDRVLFSGDVGKIMALQEQYGLITGERERERKGMMLTNTSYKQLAVITPESSLIGKTFAETDFEQEYNVLAIAAARRGEFLHKSPRKVRLKAGDLVVLSGAQLPWNELRHVLSRQDYDGLINYDWHSVASAIIMLAVVLLSIFNVLPLAEGSFIGALIAGLTGCINHKGAWNSIPWSTITVIGGSSAIGVALKTSGLADAMAHGLLSMCDGEMMMSLFVLTGVTILLTQLVSDSAVIPVMLPLAIVTATSLHCQIFPFALAVFMAAGMKLCTSFSAPHMVLCAAQGQYTDREILRVGLPILILIFITIIMGVQFYM